MNNKIDFIALKMGEGAGDIQSRLEIAHAWSKVYDCHVNLELHWEISSDRKIHIDDTDTLSESVEKVKSKFIETERVSVEHIWDSSYFRYTKEVKDNADLRRMVKPIRGIFPAGKKDFFIKNFLNIPGGPVWQFKDAPIEKRKICIWSPRHNMQPISEYKRVSILGHFVDNAFWEDVTEELKKRFPRYEIVNLSYRDSFDYAYSNIRDCAFCVGYDGMWHKLAATFGKHFATITGDIQTTQYVIPGCFSAFSVFEFYAHLHRLSCDKQFLQKEMAYAKSVHKIRMERYDKISLKTG